VVFRPWCFPSDDLTFAAQTLFNRALLLSIQPVRPAGGSKRLTAQDIGARIDCAASGTDRLRGASGAPFESHHELAVGVYVNEATEFPETPKTDAFPTEVPPPIS
jgi:hypothetical protein